MAGPKQANPWSVWKDTWNRWYVFHAASRSSLPILRDLNDGALREGNPAIESLSLVSDGSHGPLVAQIPLPPCPYCQDGHDDPNGKPWSVWVAEPRGILQPSHLEVAPSNSSHVAETDAEWLREVIRCARRG